MKTVCIVLRIALGMVFLISGAAKSIDTYGTALKISEYCKLFNVTPDESLLMFLSTLLCGSEILVGVMLLINEFSPVTECIAACMLSGFTIITAASTFVPRYHIENCGCFGSIINLPSDMSFLKNVVLLICTFCIIHFWNKKSPRNRNSLSLLFSLSILSFAVPVYSSTNQSLVNMPGFKTGSELTTTLMAFDGNNINITDSLLSATENTIIVVMKKAPNEVEMQDLQVLEHSCKENGSGLFILSFEKFNIPSSIGQYRCSESLLKDLMRCYCNGVIVTKRKIIMKRLRLSDRILTNKNFLYDE